MDIIKKITREIFETIGKALWGYALGILAFTLIMIMLKEMVRVFTELGYLQFVGISTGLIAVAGIVDYIGNYDIFITISEFIESLFKEAENE